MVRPSTRSKTAASVNAAQSRATTSPKKKAPITPPSSAAKPQSKSKSKAKSTQPKRTSSRVQSKQEDKSEDKENEEVNDDSENKLETAPAEEVEVMETDEAVVDKKEEVDLVPPTESVKDSGQQTWCVCNGADDGSPMIKCETCDGWYHFKCISLSDHDAEDIAEYFCSSCQRDTGKVTKMKWEMMGDDDFQTDQVPVEKKEPSKKQSIKDDPQTDDGDEDDDEGESSGEDYVDEERLAKLNKRKASTRVQVAPSDEESEHDDAPSSPGRRRRRPSSRLIEAGVTNPYLKRKPAPGNDDGTTHKRQKAEKPAPTAADDPIRKYCLGKLREVLLPIFKQFLAPPTEQTAPPTETSAPVDESVEKDPTSTKEEEGSAKVEDGGTKNPVVMDGDKDMDAHDEIAEGKVTVFGDELEQCIFDVYSEPDKKGHKIAGAKYKERFRMLTFNLEKEDRVILRRRIAQGEITALELSQMSSTDLANEQTKQEIESAHLQSLKHSILEARIGLPRAKITHKGEEIIDTDMVNGGEDARARAAEMEREDEEREREFRAQRERERERMREREHEHEQAEALTAHEGEGDGDELGGGGPLGNEELGLESPSATGFDISEVLGDMGLPSASPASPTSPFKLPHITIPSTPSANDFAGPRSATPRSASFSAGNSVLASALLSASQSAPSFDLGSVWGQGSGMHGEGDASGSGGADNPEEFGAAGDHMDIVGREGEHGGIADSDFDMFFDRGELFEPPEEQETSVVEPEPVPDPVGEAEAFEALPIIYKGEVQLPTDAATSWTASVTARQVGGRILGDSQSLWRQLFTAPVTRIDGRVPVDKSIEYLISTRLNASKELVAVALLPSPESDDTDFIKMQDFLIQKGRHALVFPWARIPGDQAVGKDFYLVPLKPEDPIPEYIELLDEVRLPKVRTSRMMLGVFVLHKGRLNTQPSNSPPAQRQSSLPGFGIPPPPSAIPQSAPPSVDPLAALLPPGGLSEQQKSMLQSLFANGGLSALTGAPVVPPPPPGQQLPYNSPYNTYAPPPEPFASPAAPIPGFFAAPLPPENAYQGYYPPPPSAPHSYPRPSSSSISPPHGPMNLPPGGAPLGRDRDYGGPIPPAGYGDIPRRHSEDYAQRRGAGRDRDRDRDRRPPPRDRERDYDRPREFDRRSKDTGWRGRGGRGGGGRGW